MFENLPKVKVGIVAVSRDCFPESLSVDRRKAKRPPCRLPDYRRFPLQPPQTSPARQNALPTASQKFPAQNSQDIQ